MFGFGKKRKDQSAKDVMDIVEKVFIKRDYEYSYEQDDSVIVSIFKGDDLPIGVVIGASDDNKVLSINCKLMFEIPESGRAAVIEKFNEINNSLAVGAFILSDADPIFKMNHMFNLFPIDEDLMEAMLNIAVAITDHHDGPLKEAIPEEWKVDPPEPEDMVMYG